MLVVKKLFSVINHGRKLGRRIHSRVTFFSSGQKLPRPDFHSTEPVFRQAIVHGDHTALRDCYGLYTYHGLLVSSCRFAEDVLHYLEGRRQERVAIVCPRDASCIIAQWACWMSGQTVVMLSDDIPLSLLQHYVTDSQAKLVVTTRAHAKLVAKLCLTVGNKLLILDDVLLERAREGHGSAKLHTIGLDADYYDREDALIVYTSSTEMAKGAVFSHQAIQAQVSALVSVWDMSENDCVLHTSPLHQISGIVNELACPLSVGATCVMLSNFNAAEVWSQLLYNKYINILVAQPYMYMKLIEEYEKSLKDKKDKIREFLSTKMRLMVSACAALPSSVSQRWQEISSHTVLGSYSTTETGIVMSNTLFGPTLPGYVGTPVAGTEVQIVGPAGERLLEGNNERTKVLSGNTCQGHLQVRGATLFTKYCNEPEDASKTSDGWFNTGDVAEYKNGLYKIVSEASIGDGGSEDTR